LTDLSAQYEAAGKPNRTPAEEAGMKALEAKIESGTPTFPTFSARASIRNWRRTPEPRPRMALLSEENQKSAACKTRCGPRPHVVGTVSCSATSTPTLSYHPAVTPKI